MLYERLVRPFLFALPPETSHRLAVSGLKALGPLFAGRVEDPALRVNVAGLEFANPVGLAAGFDKDAEALGALAGLGFGFLEAGTLTPRAQPGNPKPRIFRFPADKALVNRLGFNNRGAADAAARFRHPGVPVGFNIGKNKDTPLASAAADYLSCLETLFDCADFFVLNVSSPNTPGLRALQAPKEVEPLLKAAAAKSAELAKARGRKAPPLFVKISPDEESGEAVTEIAANAGFGGVVAVNTTRSREGLSSPAPEDGGLSGAPLRARSTDWVRRIYRAAKGRLAVIGAGGVFTAEDAYEKILAGASAVEVYTGFIYGGPGLARELNRGLAELLRRDGFSGVAQAVGRKS